MRVSQRASLAWRLPVLDQRSSDGDERREIGAGKYGPGNGGEDSTSNQFAELRPGSARCRRIGMDQAFLFELSAQGQPDARRRCYIVEGERLRGLLDGLEISRQRTALRCIRAGGRELRRNARPPSNRRVDCEIRYIRLYSLFNPRHRKQFPLRGGPRAPSRASPHAANREDACALCAAATWNCRSNNP